MNTQTHKPKTNKQKLH